MRTKNIGELRAVEYDPDTKEMSIIIDIEDESFKKELLQSMEIRHIMVIKGVKVLVGV